jgi:CDP-diacylglycerol---serine O-phosphatidyltransferase
MLRFVNAPNAVTLTGLLASLVSVACAIQGARHLTFALLILAGLCDLFDGLLARKLSLSEEARRFGAHLDSLVDVCSFGFGPAAALYALGLRSPLESAALAGLGLCAVWRLAYFDTVGLSGEGTVRYYTGLPVTFTALFLPLAGLSYAFFTGATARAVLTVTAVALSVLMVSPLKIRKPFGAWYGVLLAAALAVGGFHVRQHWRGAELVLSSATRGAPPPP